VEGMFVRRKMFVAVIWADVWPVQLSGIPFKVLLHDYLVGIISTGHVTKMAVKSFNLL